MLVVQRLAAENVRYGEGALNFKSDTSVVINVTTLDKENAPHTTPYLKSELQAAYGKDLQAACGGATFELYGACNVKIVRRHTRPISRRYRLTAARP